MRHRRHRPHLMRPSTDPPQKARPGPNNRAYSSTKIATLARSIRQSFRPPWTRNPITNRSSDPQDKPVRGLTGVEGQPGIGSPAEQTGRRRTVHLARSTLSSDSRTDGNRSGKPNQSTRPFPRTPTTSGVWTTFIFFNKENSRLRSKYAGDDRPTSEALLTTSRNWSKVWVNGQGQCAP